MTTHCIVGPGALGILTAALLAEREPVFLLCRNPKRALALSGKSIQVTGARTISFPPEKIGIISAEDLDQVPKDAIFWLFVKAYDLRETIFSIRHALSAQTPVVLAANGLGTFLDVAPMLGREIPLIRLLAYCGAKKESESVVTLAGATAASISSPRIFHGIRDQIADCLRLAGCSITIEPDVATAEWKKALVNIVTNSICTLHRVENGALATNPKLKQTAIRLLHEIRAVALAEGFDLSHPSDEEFFEVLKTHGSNRNSTLVDLELGRKTELDVLLGRLVRLAESYGIGVPVAKGLWEELGNVRTEKS